MRSPIMMGMINPTPTVLCPSTTSRPNFYKTIQQSFVAPPSSSADERATSATISTAAVGAATGTRGTLYEGRDDGLVGMGGGRNTSPQHQIWEEISKHDLSWRSRTSERDLLGQLKQFKDGRMPTSESHFASSESISQSISNRLLVLLLSDDGRSCKGLTRPSHTATPIPSTSDGLLPVSE
jgi:hypothetical protein